MVHYSRRVTFLLVLFFSYFIVSNVLLSKTYIGIPVKTEPGYSIDIPGDWLRKKVEGSNGNITYFYPKNQSRVVIEIRSFNLSDNKSIKAIINRKAARLSYYYPHVNLSYERFSVLRPGVYESKWDLRNKYGSYIEKSVLLKSKNEVIIAGVSAPKDMYNQYNIIFENALMSIDFSDEAKKSENKKSIPDDGIDKDDPFYKDAQILKKFYIFNRPVYGDDTIEEKNKIIESLSGK